MIRGRIDPPVQLTPEVWTPLTVDPTSLVGDSFLWSGARLRASGDAIYTLDLTLDSSEPVALRVTLAGETIADNSFESVGAAVLHSSFPLSEGDEILILAWSHGSPIASGDFSFERSHMRDELIDLTSSLTAPSQTIPPLSFTRVGSAFILNGRFAVTGTLSAGATALITGVSLSHPIVGLLEYHDSANDVALAGILDTSGNVIAPIALPKAGSSPVLHYCFSFTERDLS